MITPSQKSVLLLIDIQSGFTHPTHWGTSRSNPSLEPNVTSLLSAYRTLTKSSQTSSNHKIIHIHHSSLLHTSPLHPSSPGFAPASYAIPLPNELVLTKSVNSAFIGTPLSQALSSHFGSQGGKLYVAGLTTDHCVSTSVRRAANLYAAYGRDVEGNVVDTEEGRGEVVLIEDATACWGKGGFEAEMVHRVHVASLQGEFARVVRTGDVLEEWESLGAGA